MRFSPAKKPKSLWHVWAGGRCRVIGVVRSWRCGSNKEPAQIRRFARALNYAGGGACLEFNIHFDGAVYRPPTPSVLFSLAKVPLKASKSTLPEMPGIDPVEVTCQ
ncbi:hypothetical protein Cflav_PD3626 [Pedosphaera parvula Ellin514]|uniref:Uncharacterized protein n=1 Tax=Pedosphaera parvula (strain Ellin514) TaxID=320771 RepID=B9XHD3_PEDPL|nr:hypothetical protein Cflav_PD3626 [Pedosphaera parvula Ellin514]